MQHRWYSEQYAWFYIDSAEFGYALHVSTSAAAAGDAGDALNSPSATSNGINGMMFYSADNDNTNGCSSADGGGWWYNACSSSQLMGLQKKTTSGFRWEELEAVESDGALITSRMMIKLVN